MGVRALLIMELSILTLLEKDPKFSYIVKQLVIFGSEGSEQIMRISTADGTIIDLEFSHLNWKLLQGLIVAPKYEKCDKE